MPTAIYKTKVQEGGVLTLPQEAREELHLQDGDEVEVTVSTHIEKNEAEHPLLALAGIAKGGRSDGSINHDKYLYGTDPL